MNSTTTTPTTPTLNVTTSQNVTITIIVDGFTFNFTLPVGATLGTALNAGFNFLSHIEGLIHDAVTKTQPVQPTNASSDSAHSEA